METQDAKQIISDSKNVYLVTSEEPEAITSTLALFYTLKELSKNVNLVIDVLPENLKFLAPSLDFISYPKNFVISIPNNIAKISQISYEKNNDALKVHLTIESGNIKKDNISFYFHETKPDLIITVGVKDYQKELSNKLNSFGFLLDSPVLNIDTSAPLSAGNGQDNKKFGKINLIKDNSLTEIVFSLIKEVNSESIKKEPAMCLLSGLVLYTGNFKNKLTAEVFQTASDLMKKGAEVKDIVNNIKIV
jgi:nanoRNase/pAp phosphatase (c-di-AMP/oligoRNAs hydrolase)